jgi:hypothetical protein
MTLFTGNAEKVVGFCGVPLEKMLRVGVFVACRLAGAEPPAFVPLSTRATLRAAEHSLGMGKHSRRAGASRPGESRNAADKT